MLSVAGLTRPGLGPVDLRIGDGECLAITGPSGAGKSLLLRAIADLDPNRGDLRCNGCIRSAVPAPVWRTHVGLLPAESGWWGETVAAHFRDPGAQRLLLPEVGLPPEAMDWQVARLSSGERHRLALIRALERDPEVLLLDEPTAMLDGAATGQVEALLKARMARGLSLLMVTHDVGQPARMARCVARLAAGRLGAPEKVRASP